MRPIGVLVNLAGIGFTAWAVAFAHGPKYTFFLKHADAGFYVALGGFALMMIGSMIGPAAWSRSSITFGSRTLPETPGRGVRWWGTPSREGGS